MHIFHLTEIGEAAPPIHAPLFFGRYLAPVGADGTIACDTHRFIIDNDEPIACGALVMIWCSSDYYCCPAPEYEALHQS